MVPLPSSLGRPWYPLSWQLHGYHEQGRWPREFCAHTQFQTSSITNKVICPSKPSLRIRSSAPFSFELVNQLMLPHRLIRINIKIRSIIIIIYLTPFSSIKYSNIYSKTYIYHCLVTINFILHHTFICIQCMFNWTIYLWIGILISSIIHEYMVTYIVGSIFI